MGSRGRKTVSPYYDMGTSGFRVRARKRLAKDKDWFRAITEAILATLVCYTVALVVWQSKR